MKWLITGCRGFVGGSVGRRLHRLGHQVTGISRSSQAPLDWPGQYIAADISTDDLSGEVAAREPDVVLHAAGSASVGESFRRPAADLKASVISFAGILEAVRRSGKKPLVIFPSSAAVYGNPAQLPVAEDAALAPISPYGFHKRACELLAEEYGTCHGLRLIAARLFSVFGVAQRRLLLWEIFQQAVGSSPAIRLRGTGGETRDYLSVESVADAFAALASTSPGGLLAVNLAGGSELSVRDLVDIVQRATGTAKPVETSATPIPGDPTRWVAETRRLRDLAPAFVPDNVELGIADCVRHWLSEIPRQS